MLQELSQAISDLIYSLFGAEAQSIYLNYPIIFWGMLAAAALMPAVPALLLLLRVVRAFRRGISRTWSDFSRDCHLLFSGDGRLALRLAREIRRGGGRVRRMLGGGGEDERENAAVLRLLENFIGKDLPDTLAQTHTFIETGGAARARKLARLLARQEAEWTESGEPARREELQKEIAATRQRLAQTRHAEESREKLLKDLEEAALALRTLEMEMASLGATRSQALRELRNHLTEMAEGLHHQRQAHLSFQDNP